jgi:lipopolysaccharide transport system permease protein
MDKKEVEEVVYTSESLVRYPGQLVRGTFGELLRSRGLAWRMFVRNIQGQYRRAFLGVLWAFVPSLVMATTFTLAQRANVIRVGETDIPYPAYVVFSLMLWQTFLEALNGPIRVVRAGQSLLTRVKFPSQTLVLASLGEVLFNFAIKLIFLIFLFVVFQIHVPLTIVLAPMALVSLVLFGTAVGLWLAPFSSLYDDIARVIELAGGIWMLLTPVIYPIPAEGLFAWVVKLNPVTHLLVTTRELSTTGVVSDPAGFWIVSASTLVLLFLGFLVFRLSMPFVVERMGN